MGRLIYFFVVFLTFICRVLLKVGISTNFSKGLIAATEVGKAKDFCRAKKYRDALDILTPVSSFDVDDVYVAKANYMMGVMYLNGLGTDKNIETAKICFEKAVEFNVFDTEAKDQLEKIKQLEQSA